MPSRPGLTVDEFKGRVEAWLASSRFRGISGDPRRRIISFPDMREIVPPHPLETLRRFAGHDVEILQVRYTPALEIIVGAGLAMTGLLAIWQKISAARAAHYEANFKQAEAQMR
jgi:hypothetical protein